MLLEYHFFRGGEACFETGNECESINISQRMSVTVMGGCWMLALVMASRLMLAWVLGVGVLGVGVLCWSGC